MFSQHDLTWSWNRSMVVYSSPLFTILSISPVWPWPRFWIHNKDLVLNLKGISYSTAGAPALLLKCLLRWENHNLLKQHLSCLGSQTAMSMRSYRADSGWILWVVSGVGWDPLGFWFLNTYFEETSACLNIVVHADARRIDLEGQQALSVSIKCFPCYNKPSWQKLLRSVTVASSHISRMDPYRTLFLTWLSLELTSQSKQIPIKYPRRLFNLTLSKTSI